MTATQERDVSSTEALLAAVGNADVKTITVTQDIVGVPSLRLTPGQVLRGGEPSPTIRFRAGEDGVQLSSDNTVHGLRLGCDPSSRVIFNDTTVPHLGRLELRSLTVTGVVQILARDEVRGGHVEAHDVHIEDGDARGFSVRPRGYGVEVIPGAFTLWNQQSDQSILITSDLTGLSAGSAGKPVRGSGIFVGGAGDTGGRFMAARLETGAVYSDGGIAPGTPDRITGGVFVVYGGFVDIVHNIGPVTTYGANDMVLDNWGTVDRWTASDKITSYGPSGIGFVNFGSINRLEVSSPIETFGRGARGFNVYAGTVGVADFDRVVTHADGAVGVQVSQPVGEIKVRRGIETYGGKGESLVKGVVMNLAATALSIKPGGSVDRVKIHGGLVTHGASVEAIELHGRIGALEVGLADVAGGGFDKI
jgi:hypothetical protein